MNTLPRHTDWMDLDSNLLYWQ